MNIYLHPSDEYIITIQRVIAAFKAICTVNIIVFHYFVKILKNRFHTEISCHTYNNMIQHMTAIESKCDIRKTDCMHKFKIHFTEFLVSRRYIDCIPKFRIKIHFRVVLLTD